MKFNVTGYIAKEDKLLNKKFSTLVEANKFVDSMIEKYNCPVIDSVIENNESKYFCEDRANFTVEAISL